MDHGILSELKDASLRSATDFINVYASNEDQIVNSVKNFEGIKSEFYCDDFYKNIDTTKFLSIYSDLASFFMLPDKLHKHLIHYYPPENPLFIKRQVTFPLELLNGKVPQPYEILPCYTTRDNDDVKEISTRLSPLIDSGKFLIRPIRTIMLSNRPEGSNLAGMVYYASSDTPNDHWQIKSAQEQNSYVIDNGLKSYESNMLYEITLPYLTNIPIATLTKIINDESDLLSTFRSTLKDLMVTSVASDKAAINEIRNDKIKPQIETINRKFKSITNIHRMCVGASVIGFTISLIGVVTDLTANFQTLFNSLMGGGALGILASEVKFQTDENGLKDNPYFLLWKISKAKASKIKQQF